MRTLLSLVLPILVPSWRFFQSVEPSPRIEWALVSNATGGQENWVSLRPSIEHIPPRTMLRRLFWNPKWAQELFWVSCAERIVDRPTKHSVAVIENAVRSTARIFAPSQATEIAQFRLVFVRREHDGLCHYELFRSDPFPLAEGASGC